MDSLFKSILGLRSGKKYKRIIAITYYLLVLLMIAGGCRNYEAIENVIEESPEALELALGENEKETEEEIDEEIDEETEVITEEATNVGQTDIFEGYTIIDVYGGDTSGDRQANVAVNIGYGEREYWAFTNQHGQLVRVRADEIILQDDTKEDVNSNGRYYSEMANVPGVGSDSGYDRGHIIADSLGGVANAYNITPQDATLNRHGDQAYMEKVIRDAGGCTEFEAIITYPDSKTQIPSHYKYTYVLMGNHIVDEFTNVNPDEYNQEIGLTKNENKDNNKSSNKVAEEKETQPKETKAKEVEDNKSTESKYILNTNSKKIHYPNCHSVKRMSEKNKKNSGLSKSELINQGYDPCKNCNP